jgi:hypothetical protein
MASSSVTGKYVCTVADLGGAILTDQTNLILAQL